jgi:manganese/zinc/iron transport system permease protein
MVILSAFFGALAGVTGATLSGTTERLPTGPTIVVCISAIVLVSLLFAPNRGLLWNWLAQGRPRRRLRGDAVLADLSVLASQHASLDHGHSTAVLQAMNPGRAGLARTLSDLASRGLVRRVNGDVWTLTEAGKSAANDQSANGLPPNDRSDD